MSGNLKDKFLTYCELQRNANAIRHEKGIDDSNTIEAYEKANKKKREVLDLMSKIDYALALIELQLKK